MRACTDSNSKEQKISEDLAHVSQEAVEKLLRRSRPRGSSLKNQDESYSTNHGVSLGLAWGEANKNREKDGAENEARAERDILRGQVDEKGLSVSVDMEEMSDSDWEDGSAHTFKCKENDPETSINGITVELSPSQDLARRKTNRRASAEDKEVAELVHKVHLLCLLARGRIVDKACDDPLLQASLLSLLPARLLKLSENREPTGVSLYPLISWFSNQFKVTKLSSDEKSFRSALAHALEAKHGTPEEIAALSVALFRALNLTARFVSLLDVVSLKPEVDKCDSISQNAQRKGRGIFKNPTVMVDAQNHEPTSPALPSLCSEKNDYENGKKLKLSNATSEMDDIQRLKRKGDVEFEMQMAMAFSATTFEVDKDAGREKAANESLSTYPKKQRRITNVELPSSSSQPLPTAVGARKVGSPQYWAEVYCSGENMVGKWVHVDAINGLLGGEGRVEAAAAACRTSLRYVVGFAGYGAKDVTRRYCTRWYKVAPQRVNAAWWDEVLAPLRELESRATGDRINLPFPIESGLHEEMDLESSTRNGFVATRSTLEDMELEMRALSEPLPTNQQAYRNHPLYVLERWLTKYQIIQPKGPPLGFCSGYPVYRRSSVQMLKTKEKWLREGLQVKHNELPAKVLKRTDKQSKVQAHEDDDCEEANFEGTIELYGKWQLEPLLLPRAANGIVPKNERGQVDVWSEKCLPPGTVHLRLPRIFVLAKKLEIDYAPAMVGFEFKNGRSVPVFDGIVVCSEFKDVLLEAYAEEKERQEAEERKRNEREAMSRWYQLLSSIIIRQKLNNCYGSGQLDNPGKMDKLNARDAGEIQSRSQQQVERMEIEQHDVASGSGAQAEEHEHVFLKEYQSFDGESSLLTKQCHCGFSIQVEEF
ncbi:DNA repair protein RAD4 [Punica granatum]|uniref:DNA repair protein RAD4 n=1 Tax=Punica granatum TaxID=22663 RepID=A0A6P8DUM4_PUNGR|nr:DNA repair protein RAD4 [Punica granatum]